MSSFMEVCEGGSRVLFVGGYAGVGKTALIQRILRPVSLNQGRFVSGKCEQFQRDRPLLAPARALGLACQILLAEPVASLESWRRRLLDGLGPDAAVLFESVPDLQRLLGPQPQPPQLGPIETPQRLRTLILNLLRRLADPEQPLVLFLDDLHWADRPTLDLIDALLDDPPIQGLLLIGAYRDNEVDATPPLVRWRSQPSARVGTLMLADLAQGTLTRLLADILCLPDDAARPLAVQLHAKSGGNPFFTLELVNALHRSGVLRLDWTLGRWVWDEAVLLKQPVSPNLVEFLVSGLTELPADTTELLLAAACLGNSFSLEQLAFVTDRTPENFVTALTPLLTRGILVDTDLQDSDVAQHRDGLRFCHDRMQQAAYQLQGPSAQADWHRRIARRLAGPGVHQDRLRAAEHYALAAAAGLDTTNDRAEIRALLAEASLQARRSGALETAERFLRLAIERLPATAWEQDAEEARRLHVEQHLVLHGLGRHDETDALYACLLAHVDSPENLIEAACVQIVDLCKRNRYRDAIALGTDLLERLGEPIPMADLDHCLQTLWSSTPDIFCLHREAILDPERALGRELAAFYRHLETGALDRLPRSAPLTDARLAGAIKVMDTLLPAANFVHPMLVSWLPLRVCRLWIEAGYCESVICPTISIGPVIMAFRGDHVTADRLARLVLDIGAARGAEIKTAHGWYVYIGYISHWRHPLETTLTHARHAFDTLVRLGDQPLFAFTFFSALAAQLDICVRLADLETEVEAALSFARRIGNRHGEQVFLTYQALGQTLKDEESADGPEEAARLANLEHNPTARCYFHLHRALAALLLDDEPGMIQHADAAVALTHYIQGKYPTALANLLHSLSLTTRLRRTPTDAQAPLLQRLALNQAWLAARAADAPMNFAHLHDLVEAERLDVLGEHWTAIQTLERAMRLAEAHQRPWQRAFITERAGRLHMRHGLEYSGRALLTRAYRFYLDWGASGKAAMLLRSWPFVAIQARPSTMVRTSADELERTVEQRAAEALAKERTRADLVRRIMELVAQSTGATDVVFLTPDPDGLWQLEGGLCDSRALEPMSLSEAESYGLVAGPVLRLGLATQRPVVSEDAVIDSRFSAEPRYLTRPLCALLGLPLVVQGRVSAFLILENRRVRAAFSAEQVVGLLGGDTGDASLLQGLGPASFGGLLALHSVLESRNQDLREAHHRALDQARQALARLEHERELHDQQERFIDLVAHEYRTPLAIMQTNLDILRLSQDPAHWRKGLINMELAIDRLAEVFDGSLRRGDREGRQAMRRESIDLADWLEQRIAETRAGWPTPAPEIRLRIWESVHLQTDPALLKTVLINLLDNARKYGPAAGPIRVELRSEDGRVTLSVDNDCAIELAQESLDLLARSVRGSNSRGVPGLGMGLHLVDKLVGDLGGAVELRRDRPGRFEVHLSFDTDPHPD